VAAAAPDLTATGLVAPARATPGRTLQLQRTLANVGGADAGAFTSTWFLSDNAVVSLGDQALSPLAQSPGLAAGASDTQTQSLVIPAGTPPGRYWLGVCVGTDSTTGAFAVAEVSWLNNCVTAPAPTIVASSALAVATTSIPNATRLAPVSLPLVATGGDGTYAWDVSAGALPAGLTLSAAGVLAGAPSASGTSSFTVRVKSDGLEATQALTLVVVDGGLPLLVVAESLPAATFGRPYAAALSAEGGTLPYAWSLSAGALPDGLTLTPD
jgi:hypothetical protein